MTALIVDFGYKFPNLLDATGLPPLVGRQAPNPYMPVYTVPPQSAREAPAITRKLHELARWTTWSYRVLAQVIGSTHPTIAQALDGNVGALSRSAVQRQRLDDVYAVVSRVHRLAARDPDRTARVLQTPGADGVTATDQLINGQATTAYLVAMRVLRPTRSGNMMIGSNPLDPRRASVAVLDED